MTHVFGAPVQRKFYPLSGSDPVSLPSQSASIYLFSSQPSLADAAAGTGAVATQNYWLQGTASPYPCLYSFNQITDPEPTSSVDSRTYWEAINFVLQLGSQTQTHVRAFDVERSYSGESIPGTNVTDIKEAYPAISNYLDDNEIGDLLSITEEEFKLDLEAKGVSYARVYDLQKARLALAYKTIALAMLGQIRDQGDKHQFRYDEYSKLYSVALGRLTLPVDTNKDGAKDTEVKPRQGYWTILR